MAELPAILTTITGNVDTRRPGHPHGRRRELVAESRQDVTVAALLIWLGA